jgi:energy-coupling factor transport system ATP-binding protein
MQIIAKDLSFTYSEKSKSLASRALKNINLTIDEGDFFGIIGHTGSGKSTFVQLLNGLLRVKKENGILTVGEYDLTDKKCDLKGLRSKIGMVFQYPEHQLFAETVFSEVAFGLNNFFKGITQEEKERRVKQALELVGLDYAKYKDVSPFDLSGGQKRRVAIAGVIVTRPEILVLDEPVAGLDPRGKRELLALLHNLKKSIVKTIIIVSHDMNVISENCNRCAVFNEGEIYAVGTPKEIFSHGEKLIELGLQMPVTAFITNQLKNIGIDADNNFTVNDFIRAIEKVFLGEEKERADYSVNEKLNASPSEKTDLGDKESE